MGVARISTSEARRLGLIDPIIAKQLKGPTGPTNTQSPSPAPSKKKARRTPKPARRVADAGRPEGFGHIRLSSSGNATEAAFLFDLIPVPKERPRVVATGEEGGSVTYTPRRTKAFTSSVKKVVKAEMAGLAAFTGPLSIKSIFCFEPPPSWPLWKRDLALEGKLLPTKRPDIDNLEKAILDAINEDLIEDDALVVEKASRKIYAPHPCILVHVSSLEAHPCSIRTKIAALGAKFLTKKSPWFEAVKSDIALIEALSRRQENVACTREHAPCPTFD